VGVDSQVYRLSEGRLLRLPKGKCTPIECCACWGRAWGGARERERKGESKEAFLREMRSAKISKKRRNTASFSGLWNTIRCEASCLILFSFRTSRNHRESFGPELAFWTWIRFRSQILAAFFRTVIGPKGQGVVVLGCMMCSCYVWCVFRTGRVVSGLLKVAEKRFGVVREEIDPPMSKSVHSGQVSQVISISVVMNATYY